MSEEECALRCLTTWDCKSFDFRARFQTCFLSKTSFTKCDDCKDQGYLDCRYYERRTEKTPRSAVQLTINSVFHYRTSLTANIQSLTLETPTLGSTATLRVVGLTNAEAIIANPSGGSANVSFDGAPCALTTVTSAGEDTVDVNCTLGEVPGGFASFPMLHVADAGITFEESTWLKMPLSIESADSLGEISSSSLGGGWTLTVTGQGFSPAKSTGAETYVEVTVCGKPCEVVKSSYSKVECVVPNVTTPEVVLGTSDAVVLPDAKVISRDAGLAHVASPVCFHGIGDDHFEVGHPTCVAVFNGDPEVVGGTSGTNCHVGVDFGSFTNARVEKIRWHPLYDALEADQYINSKIQIGSLSATQSCDELSYGWRGSEYRGCQDVSEKGNPCARWDSWGDLAASNTELQGHSYCRNPQPGSFPRGIWCRTTSGRKEYCNPKMPKIEWTDVHTISVTPKMLWNEVTLASPTIGRFVRFTSPTGNCQLTEMQVIGQLVAPSETCQVAVRNVRGTTGPGLHMDLGRTAWRGGIHPFEEFLQVFTPWVTSSDENATVTFSLLSTPTVTAISPSNEWHCARWHGSDCLWLQLRLRLDHGRGIIYCSRDRDLQRIQLHRDRGGFQLREMCHWTSEPGHFSAQRQSLRCRRRQCLGEARNRLALLGSLVLVGYLGQPGASHCRCLGEHSFGPSHPVG